MSAAPMPDLLGRRVLVHVAGSVAAFKSADVVSLLRQRGAEVRVTMTEAATRLIGPATLQSVSGHPVVTDLFAPAAGDDGMEHLRLAGWAELQVVVAASADLLARLALGLADDCVTTTALACRSPLVLAPAMETAMWEHAATRGHVETLRERRAVLVGPVAGRLASGREGMGRMAEPTAIVEAAAAVLLAGGGGGAAPAAARPSG
jgi:phosphopantothenoylcysteine decarboxylase/phosphopantothenate--cysteine ligase